MADKYINIEDARVVLGRYLIVGKTVSPFDRIEANDELNSIPPVDMRPVVHSEWIPGPNGCEVCGACGKAPDGNYVTNFCHNCGADMRRYMQK